MWKRFRESLEYLSKLAGVVKAIATLYGIWQIVQMFNVLDPLKGKWVPIPQIGAVLTTLIGLGVAQGVCQNRKEYPKQRIVQHAKRWGVATIVLFLLSFNLYYGLPESVFSGWAEVRWMLTMLAYWSFGGTLGVTAVLMNELTRDRQMRQQSVGAGTPSE
jgi:hypothetical protein